MMAITEGVAQGQKVGSYIANRLQTKKSPESLLTLNTKISEKKPWFLANTNHELRFFWSAI